MTNKKFKVAAMSMALTACVAAQPLIADAADEVDTASSNNTPAQTTDTSAGSGSESKGTESKSTESKGTESKSTESKGTEDSSLLLAPTPIRWRLNTKILNPIPSTKTSPSLRVM